MELSSICSPRSSIAASEVLAASEAFNEVIQIACTYSSVLGFNVPLRVLVDSKDLFKSLSTCRAQENKSIRSDLELLRYYHETKQLCELIWILGSINLAYPFTKKALLYALFFN